MILYHAADAAEQLGLGAGGSIFMTLDGILSLVVIGLVFLPLLFAVALLGLMIAKKHNLL